MSQPHEVINLGDVEEIGTGFPSQSMPKNQPLREESNFTDGSGPLFNMYLGMAEEEDKKMAESWKADADGILVFTGLFSASVAALVAISIQDLRPNSQDTSAFYLQNIYQLLSDPNRSIPPTPTNPPVFSPPTYAVWVNTLWFLSLAISLTCGLLATLLQQWARRYIKITQTRHSPHKRARIRAFFAEGVKKLHLPWAVEALPTLLHLSLFLFFAGLLIFLFNINHTVFGVVAWWVGLCAATYLVVTLMPLFRRDSPYYAPLSLSAWFLVSGTLYVITKLLSSLVIGCFGPVMLHYRLKLDDLELRFWSWLVRGIGGAAEDAALMRSSEIDGRSFQWMVASLDEDHELEQFFARIPGFFKSTAIKDPQNAFRTGWTPADTLLELVNRTLSSHTLSDLAKRRRIAVCRKAMDVASFPVHFYHLVNAFHDWDEFSCSIDSGLILKAATYNDSVDLNYSQCMISIILARVQTQDHNWCELTTSHLGVSESVLQDYLAHGDSASLANLNCVIRRAIDFHLNEFWLIDHTTKTLESVSNFDVQGTLPELRHNFCTLWNELVLKSQTSEEYHVDAADILSRIRHIYITLHQGTASAPIASSASTADDDHVPREPSSYPLCTIAGHHPGSASIDVGLTGLPARAHTEVSPTILDGGTILDFDTPTNIGALSLPTPSTDPVNLFPTNEPSLDDAHAVPQRYASVAAPPSDSRPAVQMTLVNDNGPHSPVTPSDPTATIVIRNSSYTDTTADSISHTSLARTTSMPILPLSLTSHSRGTVTPQNEEAIVVPLPTLLDALSLSVPIFTGDTTPASAHSGLPSDSAPTESDHVLPTLALSASDSDTVLGYTATRPGAHDEIMGE